MDDEKKEDHSVNKTVININSVRPFAAMVIGFLFIIAGAGIVLLPLTPYLFVTKTPFPSEPIISPYWGAASIGLGILLVLKPEKAISIISKKGEKENL